jgi:hypothetical protein
LLCLLFDFVASENADLPPVVAIIGGEIADLLLVVDAAVGKDSDPLPVVYSLMKSLTSSLW